MYGVDTLFQNLTKPYRLEDLFADIKPLFVLLRDKVKDFEQTSLPSGCEPRYIRNFTETTFDPGKIRNTVISLSHLDYRELNLAIQAFSSCMFTRYFDQYIPFILLYSFVNLLRRASCYPLDIDTLPSTLSLGSSQVSHSPSLAIFTLYLLQSFPSLRVKFTNVLMDFDISDFTFSDLSYENITNEFIECILPYITPHWSYQSGQIISNLDQTKYESLFTALYDNLPRITWFDITSRVRTALIHASIKYLTYTIITTFPSEIENESESCKRLLSEVDPENYRCLISSLIYNWDPQIFANVLLRTIEYCDLSSYMDAFEPDLYELLTSSSDYLVYSLRYGIKSASIDTVSDAVIVECLQNLVCTFISTIDIKPITEILYNQSFQIPPASIIKAALNYAYTREILQVKPPEISERLSPLLPSLVSSIRSIDTSVITRYWVESLLLRAIEYEVTRNKLINLIKYVVESCLRRYILIQCISAVSVQ